MLASLPNMQYNLEMSCVSGFKKDRRFYAYWATCMWLKIILYINTFKHLKPITWKDNSKFTSTSL